MSRGTQGECSEGVGVGPAGKAHVLGSSVLVVIPPRGLSCAEGGGLRPGGGRFQFASGSMGRWILREFFGAGIFAGSGPVAW